MRTTAFVGVLLAAMTLTAVPPAAEMVRADEDPCAGSTPAPFVDRDQIASAHLDAVDCLWRLGIVLGVPHGDGQVRFVPRAEVSRGQFASMVHGVLGEAGHGEALLHPRRPRFQDVPDGHTFDDEVHTLARAGVIEGVTADTFAPDRALRRDQAASLLVRAAAWSSGRVLAAVAGPHFGDVARTSVHHDAVDTAFEYGLVEGTRHPCGEAGGRYDPAGGMQRQQAASVLVRVLRELDAIERGEGGRRRGDPECPSPVWEPRLEEAIAYAGGRTGAVSIAAIGTDGDQVGHRAGTRVAAASVIKVMFMVAYLDRPEVRDRALTSADRDLLEPMIRHSANDEATTIANLLGPGPMNRLAERAGMRDFSYTRPWGSSQTSARDQAAFMLEVDRFVPARHRAYALGLLTEVVPEQRWGIGRLETAGWAQHFKGGWGSGSGAVDHQVVMLRHDDGTRVAVAVMTTANASHEDGKATLEGVFRRVLAGLP